MTPNGFFLTGLHVTGSYVSPATLPLTRGANVITGASDTGKSYILQAVSYMLGRRRPPKSVPEDAGYDTLWLGIQSSQGENFILARSLRHGGPQELFHMPFEALVASRGRPEGGVATSLDEREVSQFLLTLCGLQDRKIRKSKSATEDLNFRHLRPFLLVDEMKIIEESSPFRPTGQFVDVTREASVVRMLLTGTDDSSVIAAPDLKVRKATWQAKHDLLTTLILQLENELAEDAKLHPDPAAALALFEQTAQALNDRLASFNTRILEVTSTRAEAWVRRRKLDSRAAVVEQLLSQFALLRQQYDSDADRLAFVAEGEFLLNQLGYRACPMCGQRMTDESQRLHVDVETIRTGISAELQKLAERRTGLMSTLAALTDELKALGKERENLKAAVAEADRELSEVLQPQLLADRQALAALEDGRRRIATRSAQEQQVALLRGQLAGLGAEPKRSKAAEPIAEPAVIEAQARRSLYNQIEDLLRAWKFPGVGIVEVDADDNLIIAGVPARSHGKGVRAVVHAAFSLAFMLAARQHGHPGWVVLDSPLTSYRGKDTYEVAEDIQHAFFEYIASLPSDYQVVVLENKEPSIPTDRLTYTHFSGSSGVGRPGFYPDRS